MTGRNKIYIYTKYCADCMWPDEMVAIKGYAQHFGLELVIKRTTFRPEWHKEAAELYGSEEYKAFVMEGKKVVEIMDFAKDCKNKLIKAGKKKNGETADKGQGEA